MNNYGQFMMQSFNFYRYFSPANAKPSIKKGLVKRIVKSDG